MRVSGTTITVSRGESFSYEFGFRNTDGSPHVFADGDNTYILFKVTNSLNEITAHYVLNKWLRVKGYTPTFNNNFIDLDALGYTAWPQNLSALAAFVLRSSYIDAGGSTVYYNGYSLFKLTIGGAAQYKYFKYNDSTSDVGSWIDYVNKNVVSFSSEETKEWTTNMYYAVSYVSGTTTLEVLVALAEAHGIPSSGTVREVYDRLVNAGVDIPENLDVNSPLYEISDSETLLSFSNIVVNHYTGLKSLSSSSQTTHIYFSDIEGNPNENVALNRSLAAKENKILVNQPNPTGTLTSLTIGGVNYAIQGGGGSGDVSDVTVDGTSIVVNHIAALGKATATKLGLVKATIKTAAHSDYVPVVIDQSTGALYSAYSSGGESAGVVDAYVENDSIVDSDHVAHLYAANATRLGLVIATEKTASHAAYVPVVVDQYGKLFSKEGTSRINSIYAYDTELVPDQNGKVTIPRASASTYGLMQIGTGLKNDEYNRVSVNQADADDVGDPLAAGKFIDAKDFEDATGQAMENIGQSTLRGYLGIEVVTTLPQPGVAGVIYFVRQ